MKFCPKCYSSVPNGKKECPHCGFKMVTIEPTPQVKREPEKPAPPPPQKKKAKKSDLVILIGVVAAFVLLMVLVTVPMPSIPRPATGGGSGRVAGTSVGGSSGGAQSAAGGGSSATAKPTATSGTVGMPYKVEAEGEVYFSLSKEAMEAVAKKEDIQPLLEDKKLLLIENGTRVTLVSVSGELAFVDILEGEYEGGVGYILHAALKPAG